MPIKSKTAIVLGGSHGMGKAIANGLLKIGCAVTAASSTDLDTSDLASVERFADAHPSADILVLNSGGPPKKDFFEITTEEFEKYHRQLLLGFCRILQKVKVNDGGYIFLLTSQHIKQPYAPMTLSFAYRLAFWGILKSLTKHYAERQVSILNIAPGPIKTKRLTKLVKDMKKFEATLPLKRAGYPDEIGNFIKNIVADDIKYLNGAVINFDGGLSEAIF